jgi:hypothetical protein
MEDDTALLELPVDTRYFLRVYTYTYLDEMRITVSFENDDSVVSSEHFKPLFDPFTGVRVSHDDTDMKRLLTGVSLKTSSGKTLKKCCSIIGDTISLYAADTQISYTFPYNPCTGKGTFPSKHTRRNRIL